MFRRSGPDLGKPKWNWIWATLPCRESGFPMAKPNRLSEAKDKRLLVLDGDPIPDDELTLFSAN